MAAHFAYVTEEEIDKIEEDSISTKTKQATKYGVKTFKINILFSVIFIQQNGFFPLKQW